MGKRQCRKSPFVCVGVAHVWEALRKLRSQNSGACHATGSLADLFTLETLPHRHKLALSLEIGTLWSSHNDEPQRDFTCWAGTWAYALTQPTPAQLFVILVLGNYTLWLHFND